MNTPKTLINQLIDEITYKFMVRKCRRQAILNNKPKYNLNDLYAGKIVKLEKSANGKKLVKTPMQDFAIFTSTPYYINFATGLEMEPNYYDQIGSYVIENLTPLKQSHPEIIDIYDIDESKKFSKNQIIELEKAIIEEYHPNQNHIPNEF